MKPVAAHPVSSGVEELIAQLRDEGVRKGTEEAQRIIADAQSQADYILGGARQEAEGIIEAARKEARKLQAAGEDEIRVAARNAALQVQETLLTHLTRHLRRMLGDQFQDVALLHAMIIEIAGQVRASTDLANEPTVEIFVPETPSGGASGTAAMDKLVKGLTRQVLREGVAVRTSPDVPNGIVIRLGEKDLEVNLTTESVAGLLISQMQPRFRALLEGIAG